MKAMKKNRAVFLDRDGTINEEVGYLTRMEQLRLIPEAVEAIRLINESGMKAIVITNQSGIARGYFDEKFRRLHSCPDQQYPGGREGPHRPVLFLPPSPD